MADLALRESYLRGAAHLLTDAAVAPRGMRSLPMLQAETYTGVGNMIGNFMHTVGIATEAVSDAAGEAAMSVIGVMSTSSELEEQISAALGIGFSN